jgi:broad specificity phosphatase PhoE
MKEVFFIRHGKTNSNALSLIQGQTSGSLNKEGILQISKITDKISGEKIELIISSDLARAKQSAKILSNKLGAPVVYSKLIREKDNGLFTGCRSKDVSWNELEGKYEDRKAPEGESLKEVYFRAKKFINKLESLRVERILVVSHGTILKIIRGIYLKFSIEESIERIKIKNGEYFVLEI